MIAVRFAWFALANPYLGAHTSVTFVSSVSSVVEKTQIAALRS
jgi:hypothetical protein